MTASQWFVDSMIILCKICPGSTQSWYSHTTVQAGKPLY